MIGFVTTHPALAWLGVAALLLAVEVATGTGWLLWAAGSAAAVSLIVLLAPLGLPVQLVLFALLATASSLLGRRFLPSREREGDINDNAGRLIGRQARVVAAFEASRGRVAVDGKEWAAVMTAGEPPAPGEMVEVIAASGAELSVRGV